MDKQERVTSIAQLIVKSGMRTTREFSVRRMRKLPKPTSQEIAQLRSEGVKQRASTWSKTKKYESRQAAKIKLRKETE